MSLSYCISYCRIHCISIEVISVVSLFTIYVKLVHANMFGENQWILNLKYDIAAENIYIWSIMAVLDMAQWCVE